MHTQLILVSLLLSCTPQEKAPPPTHLYSPCKTTSDCDPKQTDGCLILRPGGPGFCTRLCKDDTTCEGGTCSPVQDPNALVCLPGK